MIRATTSSVLGACAAMAIGAAAQAQSGPAGSDIYARSCAGCHQPDGSGIERVYPPLAGNEVVLGEIDPLADVVLNGRGGMPAFSSEFDAQTLADVLTHIRSTWGNEAAPVSVEAAAAAMGGTRTQEGQARQGTSN